MTAQSQHTFHEIYLHCTWHCLESRALITPAVEQALYDYIRQYCGKTEGVYLQELGGTENHLHIAVQVTPTIAPAELIGKVKGASAHAMNERFGRGAMEWQRGYGVVSFAKRNMAAVQAYIRSQKEHHRQGTVNEVLEAFETGPEGDEAR